LQNNKFFDFKLKHRREKMEEKKSLWKQLDWFWLGLSLVVTVASVLVGRWYPTSGYISNYSHLLVQVSVFGGLAIGLADKGWRIKLLTFVIFTTSIFLTGAIALKLV
jgi:hypothetical protein